MHKFVAALYPNQKGISSMVLLIVLVFAILIIWELNEYIQAQVSSPGTSIDGNTGKTPASSPTLCVSGETGNCNDTNDIFLLP